MITEVPISGLNPHPINSQIYGNTVDDDLMSSIKSKGVLTPLIITKDNIIISGHSRYYACLKLKMETIPAIESDITNQLDIEEAVIIANKQRDKTTEQKAREFEKLKQIEEIRAKERQLAGLKNQNVVTPNLTERETGESAQIAASKIGMGKTSAIKAAEVVKVADEMAKVDPVKSKELLNTLNNKSVDAAHKMVKSNTNQIGKSSFDKETEKKGMIISKLKKIEVNSIPDIIQEAFSLVSLKFQQSKYINADETAALMQTRILSDIIKGLSTDDVKIFDGLLTIQNQISKKIKKMQGQAGGLN